MKKVSFICIMLFSALLVAQGEYKNNDFKLSYNSDWIVKDMHDDILILYHTKENITMNIAWLADNTASVDRSKTTKPTYNGDLRIKDVFAYTFPDQKTSEKEIVGTSHKYLNGSNIRVMFTAKIPAGYVDYNVIYTINTVYNSIETISKSTVKTTGKFVTQ